MPASVKQKYQALFYSRIVVSFLADLIHFRIVTRAHFFKTSFMDDHYLRLEVGSSLMWTAIRRRFFPGRASVPIKNALCIFFVKTFTGREF